MKNLILTVSLGFALLFVGGPIVQAQTTQDVFKDGSAIHLSEQTELLDYTDFSDSTDPSKRKVVAGENKGARYFNDVVSTAIRYLKKLLVPITILFTVWAGLTLILSSGQEEEFDRRKRMVYAAFFGWLILLTAVILVDNIFFGEMGTILRGTGNDGNVATFAQKGVAELKGLFKYLVSFAVVVGVTFIVFSALKLILAGGEEEAQMANVKKRMVYTTGGMALLVSAEKLVSFFTTTVGNSDVLKLSTPNITKTIRLIVDWGNFFLGLIGAIAVMMLVWGGIRLIANFGVDEQAIDNAKKTLIAAAIGLVLAFSAWTLMYFLLVHDGTVFDLLR
jgi:hypothetical protein